MTNDSQNSSEWLKANTSISGWLSFFLFSVVAGGVISLIYPLATFNLEELNGNYWLAYSDVVIGIIIFITSLYTLFCFIKRKPNAIFWAYVYIVFIFIFNILLLWGADGDEEEIRSVRRYIRSIAWSIIWAVYLFRSKQVKEIIPVDFRRVTSINYVSLAIAIIIPIFMIGMGIRQLNSTVAEQEQQEQAMMDIVLEENQRTDGRVIFTIPEGGICEAIDLEIEGKHYTKYELESEDGLVRCTLFSGYDTDKTSTNFEEYCDNWRDASADEYDHEVIQNSTIQYNGNDTFVKVIKYAVPDQGDTYWRYYLLFNDATGKVLVASCIDYNTSSTFINDLLESVRFQ